MSIDQAQAVNQTVDIKNTVNVILEKTAPLAVPCIALVLIYKYAILGMNNSMDVFSRIGHYKSTKKTHTTKIFITAIIVAMFVLTFWIFNRK